MMISMKEKMTVTKMTMVTVVGKVKKMAKGTNVTSNLQTFTSFSVLGSCQLHDLGEIKLEQKIILSPLCC